MKKFLSLFMLIVMLLSITAGLNLTANAEVLTGNCGTYGSNVTYSLDTSTGVLTISGTGNMINFTNTNYYGTVICNIPWYEYRNSINDIIVENGVTSVGTYAFYGCSNLKSITIPNPNCTLSNYAVSSNTTIYAHTDSKAQEYAKNNRIPFVPTHFWNDGVSISNGCTVNGVIIYACTVCGITKQESVPAPGHKYTTFVTAPTCTERGYTTYTCFICGYNYISDYVNAIGHNVVIDPAVPATCTDTGLTQGSHCGICGVVLTKREVVPVTGHTFSEVVREPAMCNREGTMDHICEVCQYAYSTVIPATGIHSFGADGKCIYCNAYNTVAVVSVDGVSYTLNSNKEYVSSKAKKASLSKVTGGKKQFKVTWKKVSSVAGYQIQYSTDKKFKKNNKTVTAKKSSTSATVKKLKSKKTYYVRVRTYKTTKVNGKTTKVYSSWSKVKSAKTK